MSIKLTAGSSSIADLGDKYRPTKISDMFAEMYDTEWTDVMDDILESHKEWTEELVVRHIFIVLQVLSYVHNVVTAIYCVLTFC
jgi:hypothetical protein